VGKAALLDRLHALSTAPISRRSSEAGDTSFNISGRHKSLPKINLPTFHGRYQDWAPFCDLFQSLIGSNDDLTPVEKLHHLKTSVCGQAAKLISSLATTDENYERAWSKLKARYEC